MNIFAAALAARAHVEGHGLRTALYRHRRLPEGPLAVVLWQLGAEPFSAAAVGWGCGPGDLSLRVAGEPRNRDLAFAALLPFARWFNRRFGAYAGRKDQAPQVLVANGATADMLGRLGRRLAYLDPAGAHAADPELVRLGRHLLFLRHHRATPGQQLLVVLTDLLNSHWATGLSPSECQSLSALDAYIEPAPGMHGFRAAAVAEQHAVGPVPLGEDDDKLYPLVEKFNHDRGKSTDPAVVGPLLGPIRDRYLPMTRRTWELLWRCRERELRYAEAPSVARRWQEDCDAYQWHMEWMARSGLRRTRQSARQAAFTLRRLEEATRRVEAEEACDDPLRMAADILEHKAVRGRVVRVDTEHRELAERKMVKRPLLNIESGEPCLMPAGKQLWWTGHARGPGYAVEEVTPAPGGGTRVVLKLLTSARVALPAVGDEACFSVHSTEERYTGKLPEDIPWTHQPATPPVEPAPIEEGRA
jgi:hypothetical protein